MEEEILVRLEQTLKDLSRYERMGLDTSSLKVFIKNYRSFIKLNSDQFSTKTELSFEEKLQIIKSFLEDRKAFPTIKSVIDFANDRLELDFRDQKESRNVTISRIILRIKNKPELKEKLKSAVISIRNEMAHSGRSIKSKRQIITADTFSKWADIIKNI